RAWPMGTGSRSLRISPRSLADRANRQWNSRWSHLSERPRLAATWTRASDYFELTAGPAVAVSKRRGVKIDRQIQSNGLIGRDARTTSAPGRACSGAPVDSGGASRRL